MKVGKWQQRNGTEMEARKSQVPSTATCHTKMFPDKIQIASQGFGLDKAKPSTDPVLSWVTQLQ